MRWAKKDSMLVLPDDPGDCFRTPGGILLPKRGIGDGIYEEGGHGHEMVTTGTVLAVPEGGDFRVMIVGLREHDLREGDRVVAKAPDDQAEARRNEQIEKMAKRHDSMGSFEDRLALRHQIHNLKTRKIGEIVEYTVSRNIRSDVMEGDRVWFLPNAWTDRHNRVGVDGRTLLALPLEAAIFREREGNPWSLGPNIMAERMPVEAETQSGIYTSTGLKYHPRQAVVCMQGDFAQYSGFGLEVGEVVHYSSVFVPVAMPGDASCVRLGVEFVEASVGMTSLAETARIREGMRQLAWAIQSEIKTLSRSMDISRMFDMREFAFQ